MSSTDFLDFFKNAAEGTKIDLGTSSSRGGIDSIAGSNEDIQSGQSTQDIIDISRFRERINGLLSSNVQNQIHDNLIGLGNASVDISKALSEQDSKVQEQFRQLTDFLNSFNERVSGQLIDLGGSVSDASAAATESNNPLGFIFDNPLLFGLGTGGLVVGGIVLILLLKR